MPPSRPLRLADLGSGGGDTLRHIARWARRRHLSTELIGIDANPFMLSYAAEKSRDYPEISFQQLDIFAAEFRAQHFDVITCSLFCHHFTDAELVSLLRQLHQQAGVAVIINDLHRHPVAYYSIKWLTRLFRGSYLVQNDAPLSVARAFTKADWQRILQLASIDKYELSWRWAFRWQVVF
jgi:ubiquinone/menaquinone biosynthesis C-methylase UbiE